MFMSPNLFKYIQGLYGSPEKAGKIPHWESGLDVQLVIPTKGNGEKVHNSYKRLLRRAKGMHVQIGLVKSRVGGFWPL